MPIQINKAESIARRIGADWTPCNTPTWTLEEDLVIDSRFTKELELCPEVWDADQRNVASFSLLHEYVL